MSDLQLVQLLVGSVLPALVALVTARVASERLKATLLGVLAGLSAVGIEWVNLLANGDSFSWQATGKAWLVVFASAVLAHFGLLKPWGVTGTNGAVARLVPGGLGNAGGGDADVVSPDAGNDLRG